MRLSLPEERALAGKADGLLVEPVTLDIDDDTSASDLERARQVYHTGARFTSEQRDRILARITLGL